MYGTVITFQWCLVGKTNTYKLGKEVKLRIYDYCQSFWSYGNGKIN